MFAKFKWLPVQLLQHPQLKRYNQVQEEKSVLEDIEARIFAGCSFGGDSGKDGQTAVADEDPAISWILILRLYHRELAHLSLLELQRLTGRPMMTTAATRTAADVPAKVKQPPVALETALKRRLSIKKFLTRPSQKPVDAKINDGLDVNESSKRAERPAVVPVWGSTLERAFDEFGCRTRGGYRVPAIVDQVIYV